MTGPRPASSRRPSSLRRYGQNHLVDTNVLEAVLRLAAVRADDVVLEVGAAAGLLTDRLAAQATAVHAFEIDRRFAPALEKLAARHANVQVYLEDALRASLGRLAPPPTAMVANLAYSIAIPVIVKSIGELPDLGRWAVMVQRELAERLFATPRTKAYAAVSVLVQLACERETVKPVPRQAFSPPPRVDSVFVTFVRRSAAGSGRGADAERLTAEESLAVTALVRLGFGQRRKMLVNTLSGAARGGRVLARDQVSRALLAQGLPATARPEELAPPAFVALARELEWI
jgi:16S rRNA (adenine1518-N6/adenine1519-N6)-dimethyltransferase